MSSIDSAASNAPSPRPDREEGRFSTRASHLLIGKPPPSDLPNVPQNGLRFATAFGFQNIGDQVVNAKTTLPWFLNMVGAPAWIAPLLVPIRESGSMLPQAALRPWIQSRRSRLPILLAGTFGQALGCVISVCAALFTTGMAAGLLILLGLTVLALSRSLVSLTSKDIQGRTMPKGYRGRVTGFATTLSGAVAIVMGLIIAALRDSLSPTTFAILFAVAAAAWGVSMALFRGIKEPLVDESDLSELPGTFGDTVRDVVRDVWELVRDDRPFRNFVIVRSLMLASALSPTFLVTLQSKSGSSVTGLGLFVVASGLASLIGGRVSGALSDKSSKNTLSGAALFAVVLLVLTIVLAIFWDASLYYWLPVAFFGISVAHAAIRVARSTYVVDMAEGDMRTRYVSVSNTLMGLILLAIGALTSVLSLLGALWALAALAALGVTGSLMAARLPDVSAGAEKR